MKTAISLPDEVFRYAERLARLLKKTRSELRKEAVAEYVARHEPEAITGAIDRLTAELDTRPDEFASVAARRVLERSGWRSVGRVSKWQLALVFAGLDIVLGR